MSLFCCAPRVEEEKEDIITRITRTAKHDRVSAGAALRILQEGNTRYVGERDQLVPSKKGALRTALADDGQNPLAVVIGCADSRCPVETLFDADPGDVFVLRNAGNTCLDREGSVAASVEYAVGALGTKLLVVLGHTKCGALAGATKAAMSAEGGKGPDGKSPSRLEEYLGGLAPAVQEARGQLGEGSTVDEVAALAIKTNIFHTIQNLLTFSVPLRQKVLSGEVQLHGAIYEIGSGKVEFLGQHPRLSELLAFRTARHDRVSAGEALQILKEGNARYTDESHQRELTKAPLRTALADDGQNPLAVVIGCADSRCPVETLFDADPGDVFVLRNAGNTCPAREGSVIASVEYAVGALGTKLLVVLGHTKCGAIAGATKAMMSTEGGKGSCLEMYLDGLKPPVQEARGQLKEGSTVDEIAALAIRTNVFHTIQNLLTFSAPLRQKVASGEVQLHGAIYNIAGGKVEFIGQHPRLAQLVKQLAESAGGKMGGA